MRNLKKFSPFFFVFCLLLLFAAPTFASSAQLSAFYFDKELQSLIDMKEVNGNVWHFAEVIGPRCWGSIGEKQGAERMAEKFRSYGIADSQVYTLTTASSGTGAYPTGTKPHLLLHDHNDPVAADYGLPTVFNKGLVVGRGATIVRTPAQGVTGIVVNCGFGATSSDFPPAVKDNIALINTTLTTTTPSGAALTTILAAYDRAVNAGAVAVFFIFHETPRTGTSVHFLQEIGTTATGPASPWIGTGTGGTVAPSNFTIVSADTPAANRIPYGAVPKFAADDMLAKPNAKVTYTVTDNNATYNAVATVYPSVPNPNAPIIVFTGHIDTHSATAGANDDGTGMAAVLELARVFKILADKGLLKYEMVFAGVGSEEANSMAGSNAIARGWGSGFDVARRNRIIACYNFDMVAPGDPWNAGLTLSLRQRYSTTGAGAAKDANTTLEGFPRPGTSVPPIMDIVAISSLAAAERFGLPRVPDTDRNQFGKFAIKLTNGGGSDHQSFGAFGIPNANHSFRGTLWYPANNPNATSAVQAGDWGDTVPLETRYHNVGDTFWDNYDPKRMEIALKISGASSFAIAKADTPQISANAVINPQPPKSKLGINGELIWENLSGEKVALLKNLPANWSVVGFEDESGDGWFAEINAAKSDILLTFTSDKKVNDSILVLLKSPDGTLRTLTVKFSGKEQDSYGCNYGMSFLAIITLAGFILRRRF